MSTNPVESTGKKPIHLAYVIGSLERGGTELHLLALIPELIRLGYRITVFSLHDGGSLREDFRNSGAQLVCGSDRRGVVGLLRAGLSLLGLVRKDKVDMVHFFLPEAYIVGGLSTLLQPRLKRLMSRRGLNTYQHKYPGIRWLERLLHSRMDRVLGNSLAVVKQLYGEGVKPAQLGLIYNGVVTPASEPACTSAPVAEQQSPNLRGITVANLIAYKGHEVLLRALSQVESSHPGQLIWTCVGADRGIGDALRQLCKSLQPQPIVSFVGAVKNPGKYLASSEIAVLPSLEEGFSNALLEKMAAGLAIVATNVGGNAEALGDAGQLVAANDAEALASALRRYLDDPSVRITAGRAAQRRAAEKFSMPQMVDAYDGLYQYICDPKNHALAASICCTEAELRTISS